MLSFDDCPYCCKAKHGSRDTTSIPQLFVAYLHECVTCTFLMMHNSGTGQGYQSHVDAIANSCGLDTPAAVPILTAQNAQGLRSSRLRTMATTSRRAKRAKVSCCGRRCSSATVPCTYKASKDLVRKEVPSDNGFQLNLSSSVFAQTQTYSGIGQWQKASCCGPQVCKLILPETLEPFRPETLRYSELTRTYVLSRYTILKLCR